MSHLTRALGLGTPRVVTTREPCSPVEVTEHYLARIETHDAELRTFATLDGRRRTGAGEARRAGAAAGGDSRGSCKAYPIAVKENIPVAGLPTTGLGGRGGDVAGRRLVGIERLRRAGAVVLGTNAMHPPGRGAEPGARNPWDTDRVPGASSAGSGAAVAAFARSDRDRGETALGSTRLPAAFCGVVGLQPVKGNWCRMSTTSNPRLAFGFTIGPIARDVRDVAMALQVMSGPGRPGRRLCIESEARRLPLRQSTRGSRVCDSPGPTISGATAHGMQLEGSCHA